MSASEEVPAPQPVDARPPVLALAMWAGSLLCLQGRADASLACAVAGAVALAWGRRRLLAGAVGLLLLACLVTAGLRSWVTHSGPVQQWADDRVVAVVEVGVGPGRESVTRWGRFWAAPARVEKAEVRGQEWLLGQRVELTASGDLVEAWAAVVPGSRVRATVRFRPAEAREQAGAVATVREPPVLVTAAGPVESWVEVVRAGLREAVSGLDADRRALVPALVVGDTTAIGPALRERFLTTGLTHLTAVSGANLVLLLASLLWVARRVGVRGWWLRGLAVVAVSGFVVLCHGEPSVLRAAAMGCVGVAALGWGGPGQGLRFLSWAVVGLLMLDPWLASSAGFALSVMATAGIVLFARSWTSALAAWLPRGLAEALAVPLAAQCATLPAVAALSGQVSLVGVVANLLAGPLVGPTTVVGFGCAVLGWWAPGPASWAGWLAGWGAQGLLWIAELGASLPSAALPWPSDAAGVAVLVAASLSVFVLASRWLRRRWLVAGVAVALAVVLARPWPVPGWPPSGWAVVQCDVGQGSATVVAVADAEAVVVDTGTEPGLLERCLGGLGVRRVPLLVVTHFHADHIGGVAALASRDVETVVLPPDATGTGRDAVLAAVPRATVRDGEGGLALEVGNARVEVVSALSPSGQVEASDAESSAENDASVVVRIGTGEVTVLAAGDIEHAGQAAVLTSGAELRADVLVVPHHGSSDQSPDLLAAVDAPIAVIGVGKDNDYGHPTEKALRLLAEAGSAVYRTDTQGAIAVARTGQGYRVTTERG